jgi:acetolactate synthase-1/2/3 large subunit
MHTALVPRSGPTFLDFPLDHVFGEAPEAAVASPPSSGGAGADAGRIDRVAALLREAERPVVMAGTGLYWGHGEDGLRALAEELRIPVFLNGLARGCLPADHELYFSRARGDALRGADLALVIGVPLDFRLGFGAAFADDADVVIIDVAEPQREHPRPVAAELYGALPATLDGLRVVAAGGSGVLRERERWVDSLRSVEQEKRAAEAAELSDERAPLHPMRVYGELARVLDRDAIVVGDGGDFVSYAGRVVDSFEPGCWLDPGPYGCLGSGPGYALAAKLARPERQVVLLLGDGAFGFSGLDFDTLARHDVAVVAVMGNNGIWALEKHPMESIYGYSVAAELRPETRYDEVVRALGCEGSLVREPRELRPALEQALASGRPTLVNVLTDPSVAYPRRSSLA